MKKSILILTDLTKNAMPAAEAALALAGQLKCSLILLHSNDTISAFTYYAIVPVISESPNWHEERKSSLLQISNHLQKKYADTYPESAEVDITVMIKEGNLWDNTKTILKQHSIELIVMGARSGSSMEHLLFGSDTKNIIDHSTVPVLVVPQTATIRAKTKITSATNLLEQDLNALNYLGHLRERLQASLDIVHIRRFHEVSEAKNSFIQHVIGEFCKANPSQIIYKEVYGKNPVSRIKNYCKENGSDVLALSQHHHSLMFQAFRESTIEKTLSNQIVPLLIIPKLNPQRETLADVFKEMQQIVL